MPDALPVHPQSLLGAYAARGAYTDCFALAVPHGASLPQFIEAFYTTRLFKLERWLLARLLQLPSTDAQARQLAQAGSSRFSAWTVEGRTATEILLDAGQTRSWLSVLPVQGQPSHTLLLFGSAVVPLRPGGGFGRVFHALLGFHTLYSKLLLSAAARRLGALQQRGHVVPP